LFRLRRPNRGDSQSSAKVQEKEGSNEDGTTGGESSQLILVREFDDSIETAFQLATFKGPLCAEPMSGMCFSIERLEIESDDLRTSLETSQFLSLIDG
jgi:ribosome assembly protein 1